MGTLNLPSQSWPLPQLLSLFFSTSNAHTVQSINMGKAGKRSHDEVDTYEEDDFVENDDGAARKTKKTKKAEFNSDDQEKFWELSKGNKLISLREFYEKDGKFLPGSKGLSLTIDQYKNLLNAIPTINKQLKGLGIDVSASAASDEESEGEIPKKRVKAKKEAKANIEATSEEDDE